MLPVLTPSEVAEVDAAAPEPIDVLVARAGAAVAWAARRQLGGTYGRRVVVLAGKGNNGADGRVAARRLAAWGARVEVLDVVRAGDRARVERRGVELRHADLVIDAAFGTGLRNGWDPPATGSVPVLAVDLPSGVDGLTGAALGEVLTAERTVTFAALKPGLLFQPGAHLAGDVELVPIGLDVSRARTHWVEGADLVRWLPTRRADAHKWQAAVVVVAGSPGMHGAAHLAARAAQRAGAGMVRLGSPGSSLGSWVPTEVVGVALPPAPWEAAALDQLDRAHAVVVGPGLGRADATGASVRALVTKADRPVVVDGDGLWALGWSAEGVEGVLRDRTHPTVLTPHDGEYALLTGQRVGSDRLSSARRLAAKTGAVVLLKGRATVVASPDGEALVVTAGDERLATAGTGDVLAGVIGALVAQGLPAFEAAAAGAEWHGRAGRLGPVTGLVAGDLPELLAPARAQVAGP